MKEKRPARCLDRLVRVVGNYVKTLLHVAFVLAALWLAISTVIFRFRHPWATETETFLHIPDAFMLRKVPYAEMSARE